MAGVVHRRGGVIARCARARTCPRCFAVQREDLGDLDAGGVGLDRLERPADFARRVGLHVPGVELAGRAEIEDHDAGALVLRLVRRRPCACRASNCGSDNPMRAERADLQEVAARDAVAGGDGALPVNLNMALVIRWQHDYTPLQPSFVRGK